MTFRITGLSPAPFQRYFAMSARERQALGIDMVVADDSAPGFPCRVSLMDAAPGERLLLINHQHQPANSPYRSAHAIFVAEDSNRSFDAIDEVPPVMTDRLLSLRAFDAAHRITDADVIEGTDAAAAIAHFFTNPDVLYQQAHFAKRGCFAATITRAA